MTIDDRVQASETAVIDPCIFCAIGEHHAPARVIAETEVSMAFFPLHPATLGHTLVIPKVHVQTLWDLNRRQAAGLWDLVLPLAHAIREALEPQGLNLINSSGKVATQSVPHLHLHLVPRWRGDEMGDLWPPPKERSVAELDEASEKLRLALARQI